MIKTTLIAMTFAVAFFGRPALAHTYYAGPASGYNLGGFPPSGMGLIKVGNSCREKGTTHVLVTVGGIPTTVACQ